MYTISLLTYLFSLSAYFASATLPPCVNEVSKPFVLIPDSYPNNPCNVPLYPPNQYLQDHTGNFFSLSNPVNNQQPPYPFFLNHTFANYTRSHGRCLGSLNTNPPSGGSPEVAFIDYLDNNEAFITFNSPSEVPSPNAQPPLSCYIEKVAGQLFLQCQKGNTPGIFYVCCNNWRFGEFVGEGTSLTNCAQIKMYVNYYG